MGALSIIRQAFVSTAPTYFLGFFHIVPCTYSIGAIVAALRTAGPTTTRIVK